MTQSHAEWLRTIDAHPLSISGHVTQPHRLYFELTEADVQRFRIIADAHDALVEALKEAVEACEKHNCTKFRPCLDWPNEAGWWWCDKPQSSLADVIEFRGDYFVDDDVTMCSKGSYTTQHGPARFVKLTEPNPFEKEPQ